MIEGVYEPWMSPEGRAKELPLVYWAELLEVLFCVVTRAGKTGLKFQSAYVTSPASRPNHLKGAMSAA
jgi:hypothetical protein